MELVCMCVYTCVCVFVHISGRTGHQATRWWLRGAPSRWPKLWPKRSSLGTPRAGLRGGSAGRLGRTCHYGGSLGPGLCGRLCSDRKEREPSRRVQGPHGDTCRRHFMLSSHDCAQLSAPDLSSLRSISSRNVALTPPLPLLPPSFPCPGPHLSVLCLHTGPRGHQATQAMGGDMWRDDCCPLKMTPVNISRLFFTASHPDQKSA